MGWWALARGLVLLCLALACVPPSLAQHDALPEPRLERVGDSRSINDGVVTALAQDETGLIWVGTTVGIVRHDGYQQRAVPMAPAGKTRAASLVRVLLAAPGGMLWAGLEGEGLARLDIASQQWTQFRPDAATPGQLASGTVRALALDKDGVLWVGTIGGGLHSLAPGATVFRHYRRQDGALPDDRVHSLLVDSRGDLWVGTWNGLVRRARGGTGFEPVLSVPVAAQTLAGRTVSMLGEAPDGHVWAGTRQGDLVRIDPASRSGVWLDGGAEAPGPGGPVLAMTVKDGDEVWVGREGGLELRAASDGRLVQRLRRSLNRPWGLAGNQVAALLRDTSGTVWVGSYGGGLQRHSERPGVWVRRGSGVEGSVLEEADVRSLHALRNGEIWAGTSRRGLAMLDAQLRQIGEIQPRGSGPTDFAGGQVGAITQSGDGHVWVGTDTGIYEFNERRQLLARHAAGQGRARRLLATRDGALWVGTQDGLYRRPAAGAAFQRVPLAAGGELSGNVNALAESADGGVWVGGNSGLHHVRPGQAELQAVAFAPEAGLIKPVVLGLLVGKEQLLWVDTSAGLHRLQSWDGHQARFQAVAAAGAGTRSSFGANLLQDAQGRIWTHQGFFDPRDGSRYELGPADGVDIGTGWFRSYTALPDGRMLFGGNTGILVIEPEAFKPWDFRPPVVVSDLRVDGEPVPLARLQGGLKLSAEQRRFSVEFAALDYTHPERNRYRYRLDGLDSAWIESGADFRVASYGNLAPGRYVLQVQGSNRVGAFSPQVLDIPIEVLPAWWQTWWVRFGGLALLLLLLGWVVQLRTGMLRRQQAVLEQRVLERTEALEALSRQLQQKSLALEASSLTDPLTGLHNRRYLAQNIDADVALSVRYTEQRLLHGGASGDEADIVFFLIDIDHFKQVNDQYGHAAGDAVLVQMRERLQQAFRLGDHLVRWGGEEFLIVARATAREGAGELAERVCRVVGGAPFVLEDGTALQRSCSVGFAAFPPAPGFASALSWSAVVDLADAALYTVKRRGRDGWLGVVSIAGESADEVRAAAAMPLREAVAAGRVKSVSSVVRSTAA